MFADVIVNHLRDLGFNVAVNRATGFVGMTAVKDGQTHVSRVDDHGHDAETRAAIMLAKSCGVDVED